MVMTMLVVSLSGAVLSVNAAAGDITRVSVDSTGAQANGSSRHSQISGDGRFVVFESDATNLAGGTGGLFLKDRQTGSITRVGVDGEAPSISNDGRFIAFDSGATNEVSGDANGLFDVFVYDRQSGVTILVSVDSSGTQENADSMGPVISGDGRYIAFPSAATNLVSNDTNGMQDVFVHDRLTGITERVSIASDGAQGNAGTSSDLSISSDGRIVVFTSSASNLVSGDTNGQKDVFVRDRQTATTTRVSVNSSGVEADHGASDCSLSADGRYVSFSSFSENLISQAPLNFEHVFVHDRQTGITTLASSYSDGSQMQGRSEQSVISADGRYVAFEFDDRGDSLPYLAIYIHDRQTGATISAPGGFHQASSFTPSISGDGRYLTYWTPTSLVPGDTNGTNDIYIYEPSFAADLIPTVVSIQPLCGGGGCYPSASTITFSVTFSEIVTGVNADDFSLSVSGGISGASVTDVSGSGNSYIVSVNTGTGDGTLRLDVTDDDSIQDITLNPLGGAGAGNGIFNSGALYTVHKSIPTVTSIVRADPNPTNAGSVHFMVNFNEEVSGVDMGDFVIATTGSVFGAAVADVIGAANAYTVTVNISSGDGTLRLDVLDDDSIVDVINNRLGGDGAGSGNFSAGEAYQVEKNPPRVISILRIDANPTSADSVNFMLTFSEAVSGVDSNDFVVTTTGSLAGTSIVGLSGSASTYVITVATGSGNGNLRLDLIDDDTIVDSVGHPLGGPGIYNGSFGGGEAYTITKFTIVPVTESFRSTGARDGWVLESSEDSNVGGTKNSNANFIKVGDDAQDRQFRSILHFPTYYLPDHAVVTQLILMIKKQDVIGIDPFSTHQNISIDIRWGLFSNFNLFTFWSLQLTDFQAPADMSSVGTIQNNPVNGWYWAMLDSSAFPYINLFGVTQIRLGFQLADNDDLGEDSIRFYSGDFTQQTDRPHLQIVYYVPK